MEFAERPVSELVVRLVKIVKLLLYDTTSGDFLLQRSDPLFHESSTHGVHRVWFSRTKVRSVVRRRFAVSRQPKSLDGAERAHRPARRALSRRSASMLVSHGDARVVVRTRVHDASESHHGHFQLVRVQTSVSQRHLASSPRGVVQRSLRPFVQNPLLPRAKVRAREPQSMSRVSRRLQQTIVCVRASKAHEPVVRQHLQLTRLSLSQRVRAPFPIALCIDHESILSLPVPRLVDLVHAHVRMRFVRSHEGDDVARFDPDARLPPSLVINLPRPDLPPRLRHHRHLRPRRRLTLARRSRSRRSRARVRPERCQRLGVRPPSPPVVASILLLLRTSRERSSCEHGFHDSPPSTPRATRRRRDDGRLIRAEPSSNSKCTRSIEFARRGAKRCDRARIRSIRSFAATPSRVDTVRRTPVRARV